MIILASNSPRRKELMEKYITKDFLVVPSQIEEISNPNLSPIENTLNIAKQKGESIFKLYPEDIVISCDTIVYIDNKIYGKPKDTNDAYHMLKELSDKKHYVATAYWIFTKDKIVSGYVVSKVKFFSLNDKTINEYIATGSPFDKAGGYGIQDDYAKNIVESYEGSLSNIIGYPYEEIKKALEGLNN